MNFNNQKHLIVWSLNCNQYFVSHFFPEYSRIADGLKSSSCCSATEATLYKQWKQCSVEMMDFTPQWSEYFLLSSPNHFFQFTNSNHLPPASPLLRRPSRWNLPSPHWCLRERLEHRPSAEDIRSCRPKRTPNDSSVRRTAEPVIYRRYCRIPSSSSQAKAVPTAIQQRTVHRPMAEGIAEMDKNNIHLLICRKLADAICPHM